MANKRLEGLSYEELLRRRKIAKSLSYILLGLILIYGIYMFYQMYLETWNSRDPIIVLPFFLMIMAFSINRGAKSINAEIAKRKQSINND